jgi:RNA polymerase sigma factor (sigma-70 family)
MLAPARPSGDVMTRARRGMRLLQWAMPTPMPRADFEVLLARYARMIDAVARRVCGRHHHCLLPDVEQEVRLALWRRLQDGDAIRHPAAYVYKVALATSLAVVRRYRPAREDLLADPEDGRPPRPEWERLLPPERTLLVEQVLERLTPDEARALRGYMSGLNHEELARLYGWTASSSRHRVYRTLEQLRKELCAER